MIDGLTDLDFERFRTAKVSDMKPSEWTELNRVLTSEVSPRPGPYSYGYTPYLREIVDCLSPYHPARVVAVMKGAQIGFSSGVIESGIGWIISQNPGNILFLSGHGDLSEEAMNTRIDQMIDSCGLRGLIRPNVMRKKNQRTGDTSKSKEFPGGSLVAGSASNHKLLRQRSVRYAFIDDFDAAKKSDKSSGSTTTMIEQRLAAYYDKMKLFYISTPELKETSNIEPVFLLGDRRYYHVPCPICGEFIILEWQTPLQGTDEKEMAGITWRLDGKNELIEDSVGYVCQCCGGFFDESKKREMLNAGHWKPTAEPSEIGYYSYHISCLYAPPGMYNWVHYVRQYLKSSPPGGQRKESLYQTFVNLALGLTYEQQGKSPEASSVQKNVRNYPINVIPESVSEKDGNGKIILLTCAADLNGTEHDARLDYEIVAWSESGSSYGIVHGSIGTFVPRESTIKNPKDRVKWSYEYNTTRNVWGEFDKILQTVFATDTGRKMGIAVTAIDSGHYTNHAYAFIDRTNHNVFGVKGDKENKYRKEGYDMAVFKPAKERSKLFMLDVNKIKDDISSSLELMWRQDSGDPQPPGFMNFPLPSEGKYMFDNYFSHFEAEHRVKEYKDGEVVGFRWKKKQSNSQNHQWDVYIYNLAIRDIWAWIICREAKLKTWSWADFVRLFTRK